MKPATQGCHECPINKDGCVAFNNDEEALGVIKRQQAEIERLTVENLKMVASIKRLKGETLQQLREKCNEHQDFHKGDDGVFKGWISTENLDRVIDEM